ncbi:MAG: hypothetical protein V4596_04015 [Bdellovibrionota bacterium]
MKKLIFVGALSYLAVFLFVSCSPQEGEIFHGALGLNEARVIVSSSIAGSQLITMFDQDGNYLKTLYDYTDIAGTPRGLAKHSAISFIAAIDGLNQFDILSIDGSRSVWSTHTQVTATFYDMIQDSANNMYAIEVVTPASNNQIEKFDSMGKRIPISATTAYINNALGGCTLSTPTSMAINSNGQLTVANNVTSTISVYNLGATPTCAVQTAFGNNPRGLLAHSNGSLYVVTIANAQETLWRADSQGANAQSLFANNITILQDGFAMAELPNGNILVSSFGTDSIVEFTEDGTYVKNFAKSAYTNDVYDILVLGGN